MVEYRIINYGSIRIMYETKRLILREWLDKDLEPFFALNQDLEVMRYFPKILTMQETIDFIIRIKNEFEVNHFGLYACELKNTHQFIGFVGLAIPNFEAPFTPCVEIEWRIAKEFWGQGLAVEAAQKCLEIGFNEFNLNEIIALTAKINKKSERVMQKLNMTHDEKENFYHPKLPKEHPLSLHVLYRLIIDG